MKRIVILLSVLICPLFAGVPSEFLEGNAAKRSRLQEITIDSISEGLELDAVKNITSLDAQALEGKVVVLDFWATWCGPCISSISKLNALSDAYKDQVIIIGVCNPKGGGRMGEIMDKHGINYPIGIDANRKYLDGLKVNGFPDYYVFDQQGDLVAADVRNSKVEAVIKHLLEK